MATNVLEAQGIPLEMAGTPEVLQAGAPMRVPAGDLLDVVQGSQERAVLPPSMRDQTVPGPTNEAAVERARILQLAAEEASQPLQTGALLSTLAGLAGNIAGAVTGQGAVGNSGLALGQQLTQQAQIQQQRFINNAQEEAFRMQQERARLAEFQNKKIQADSLAPLIESRVPDAKERAALFAQLAALDVEGVRRALAAKTDDEKRAMMEASKRAIGAERLELARERLELTKAQLAEAAADRDRKAERFALKDVRDQEKQIAQEASKFEAKATRVRPVVNAYERIEELLGNPESPEAAQKIARLFTLQGGLVGRFRGVGTEEDKRLTQALNQLGAQYKTKLFGQTLTKGEEAITTALQGFKLGDLTFNNILRDPTVVQNFLSSVRGEIESELSGLESSVNPATLEKLSANERALTLRRFTERLEARRNAPSNLNQVPAGVNPNIWIKMTPQQKQEFYRRKGLQ